MVPEDAGEAKVRVWVETECGGPEGGAVMAIRSMRAVKGYRSWAVELWNANDVTKLVSSNLRHFRNDFVMVERSQLREEREDRWSRKQAYLLRIQKTAGNDILMDGGEGKVLPPGAAAAAEKTTAAMTLPSPCLPTRSTPSRPFPSSAGTAAPPSPARQFFLPLTSISVPSFTNSPSHGPPANDGAAASEISYASGDQITATILREEDLSFPDNQLDDRFALIGDGSWDANTLAEFPDAVGEALDAQEA
ncbi:hypothetical protein JCM11251_005779 [Rhodosporidiobolus azoricus]